MVAVWNNDGTFEMLREVGDQEGNEERDDDDDEECDGDSS